MTTSTTSTQDLVLNLHPRKYLLDSSLYPVEIPAISPAQENHSPINNYFHANAAMLVLVLICTIMSSFGLFCMVKCAFRGSTSESGANPSAKLANVGVEKKALKAFPTVKYATELKLPGLDNACVICLSEFVDGECLRILPKCNHGFHTRCIDAWLSSHSSCPTCRHCLTEMDQKADHCSQSLPVQESVINIEDN